MTANDADTPDGYPSPEEEGFPDYADDDSTAFEDADRPRFRDSPAMLPGDEPQAVEEYGTTAAEQRHGEPLERALRREEPDLAPDEEARREDQTGRLVEADEGAHTDEEEAVLAGRAGGEGLSAEEAAVHDLSEEEALRGEVPGDEVIADREYEERAYEQWPEQEGAYGGEEPGEAGGYESENAAEEYEGEGATDGYGTGQEESDDEEEEEEEEEES